MIKVAIKALVEEFTSILKEGAKSPLGVVNKIMDSAVKAPAPSAGMSLKIKPLKPKFTSGASFSLKKPSPGKLPSIKAPTVGSPTSNTVGGFAPKKPVG